MLDIFIQLGIIGLSILGGLVAHAIRKRKSLPKKNKNSRFFSHFIFYLTTFGLQLFALLVFSKVLTYSSSLLQISVVVFGSLIASFPFKKFLSKILAFLAIWFFAFSHIAGVLQPTLNVLSQIVIKIGPNSLSLLAVLKSLVVTTVLVCIAFSFSNYLERLLKTQKHVQDSFRMMISKLLKTFFIIISIYIGFSLLGIDLSAFTFFAGALGVGIAFGLQNIFSNFFCGFILLIDRSIKQGDVISIEDGKIYGVVNKLHARYVAIRTQEGKEHLIPNQEIVSNKLENWSYSDTKIRLEIPFKVSFKSDLKIVEELLIEIAKSTNRVLNEPIPSVRFSNLIDNAVELLLRFWIADPQNGSSDIRSEIIQKAWKAFNETGIKVPYPPREIFRGFKASQAENNLLNTLKN